MNSANWGSWS